MIDVPDKQLTPFEAHRACKAEIERVDALLVSRKFPKGWKQCAQTYVKELRAMLPQLKAASLSEQTLRGVPKRERVQ